MHRGEITKLSRECQIYGDRVTVKYGFAGRVLLGPRGARAGDDADQHQGRRCRPQGAGQRQSERVDHRSDRNPVGYFSMVKEITFPITMGMRPEDYKVFVAFERTQASAG